MAMPCNILAAFVLFLPRASANRRRRLLSSPSSWSKIEERVSAYLDDLPDSK
jgi:hypothetical protein